MPTAPRTRAAKPDAILVAAADLAYESAVEAAGGMGVGEHTGYTADAERVLTHTFACPHPGYVGWSWSVTLVRASRAKTATVTDVVLLPGAGALVAGDWLPWAERIQAGDATPGLLMPTAPGDPRLEPGFTGGEQAADEDPADRSELRAVAAELGLGRERVLAPYGQDEAAERWLAGDPGPDNQLTRQAPAVCETCGFFLRLRGRLGVLFGACANTYSPSDGQVVSVDHGCGAHSGVPMPDAPEELAGPVWETIDWDDPVSLFD